MLIIKRITIFFLSYTFLGAVQSYAQSKFIVSGKVIIKQDTPESSSIALEKNGQTVNTYKVGKSGKFDFELEFNSDYILTFTKDGFVTKKISIVTEAPSERITEGFGEFGFEVSLFKQYDKVNIIVFNQPVAIIKYYESVRNFDYDTDYTRSIISKIQDAEKELEKMYKEELKNEAKTSQDSELASKQATIDQLKAEAEARKKLEAEKLRLTEEARLKKIEQEKVQAEARKKAEEERLRIEAEAKAKLLEKQKAEAEARRQAELKAQEEARLAIEAKLKAEEEVKKSELAARKKAEEDALKKKLEEIKIQAEAQKKAEEERARLAEEEKQKKLEEEKAAAETRKKADQEKARLEAEAKAKLLELQKAEAEARNLADLKAQEEALLAIEAKLKTEDEAKKAEMEAHRKAAEEALEKKLIQIKAEAEAIKKEQAEAEAKEQAALQEKVKNDLEMRIAESKKKKEEEEARRKEITQKVREANLVVLQTKIPDGKNIERFEKYGMKFTRITIKETNKLMIYSKVEHKWGAIFYFRDNECISQNFFYHEVGEL